MAVTVQPGAQTLRTGIPEALFDLTGREQLTVFDVSPDGTRIAAQIAPIERSLNPVTLVMNWHRELERRTR